VMEHMRGRTRPARANRFLDFMERAFGSCSHSRLEEETSFPIESPYDERLPFGDGDVFGAERPF
jgi:hypothetical protein